jgi:hypothetical protein
MQGIKVGIALHLVRRIFFVALRLHDKGERAQTSVLKVRRFGEKFV